MVYTYSRYIFDTFHVQLSIRHYYFTPYLYLPFPTSHYQLPTLKIHIWKTMKFHFHLPILSASVIHLLFHEWYTLHCIIVFFCTDICLLKKSTHFKEMPSSLVSLHPEEYHLTFFVGHLLFAVFFTWKYLIFLIILKIMFILKRLLPDIFIFEHLKYYSIVFCSTLFLMRKIFSIVFLIFFTQLLSSFSFCISVVVILLWSAYMLFNYIFCL